MYSHGVKVAYLEFHDFIMYIYSNNDKELYVVDGPNIEKRDDVQIQQ